MKPFTALAVVVFGVIALAHLLRLVFGWQVVLEGWTIPVWASAAGLVVAAGLAIMLWRENRKP